MSSSGAGRPLGQELGGTIRSRATTTDVDSNRHPDAVAQIDGAPDGLDVRVTIVEVEVHQ